MRRVRVTKILIVILLVLCSSSLTGCKDLITFDKNKNPYITEPYNKKVDESTTKE